MSSNNNNINDDDDDIISFISPSELGDEQKYITKAEEGLRMLVNEQMTDKFGAEWMSLPNGLGEKTVQELRKRQEEEAKTLRNNPVQKATLLDYCYLVQLKEVILNEKNWGEAGFSEIFPKMDRTRTMLQIISEFRNPEMHGRASKLLFPHQKHLCIGLAGELLLIVERWRTGFKQQVKSYEFHFHFKPPAATSDATDASAASGVSLTEQQQQQRLIKEVAKWVESFKAKTNVNVVDKSDDKAFVYTLSVPDKKGNLTMYFEKTKEGNCRPMQRKHEWYVHLLVTTDKLALIDWIMNEEGGGIIDRPYWVYRINMKDRLEAAKIKARIKEVTGQKPTGWSNDTLFNYPFGNFCDDAVVRLTLKDDGQIEIVFDDSSSIDTGFYQMHKYFTYQVILYALYGELTSAYKHRLIRDSCAKPSKLENKQTPSES